jgi:hypothetical protein
MHLYILSKVDTDEMIGFLTRLRAAEGRSTVFEMAKRSPIPIESLVWISGALEYFRFLSRREGGLEMTAEGDRYLAADADHRKQMIRAHLERDESLRDVLGLIRSSENRSLSTSSLLRKVRRWFPASASDSLLMTLISWGRYTALVHYDDRTKQMSAG